MLIVYSHTRLDHNIVFYIGVGLPERAYDFSVNRNAIWKKIKAQTKVKVDILYENLSFEQAYIKEKELIKFYGRLDNGTGTLANMTDGGAGVCAPSEAVRQKKRMSMIGKNKGDNHWLRKNPNVLHPLLGKKHSEDTRGKMSKSHLGKITLNRISIKAYKNGELIGSYNSLTAAGKELGRNFKHISVLIKQKRADSEGFSYLIDEN